MTGVRVHGALFALAVIGALLTWTRDSVPEAERELTLVWERDTTDVVSVHYRGPALDIEIRRLTDDDGAFLWATEIKGADGQDTLAFPVGAPGNTLVGRLATLRVIRDLGVLSPEHEARFGLVESKERIAVQFGDELRELLLGDSTYASSDRYAVEPATGAGYVVSSDIVNPLRIGEGALRERWLHHFPAADIAMVRVAAGSGERTMARTDSGEWTEADGGDPDTGFANFMQRVDQLAIAGYGDAPAPVTLRPLLRVEYLDDDGVSLGFTELVRDEGAERDPYYVRSERTRVLARAVTTLAERVEQGLGEIF